MKQKLNVKITLPESTDDITLEMYLKLESIFNREDLSEYEIENRAIKAVTGMRYNLIEKIKQSDREEILAIIQKALSTEDAEFKDRFELDGITFGFIPNFDKIASKEWFDLKNYESKPDKAHRLMSILFRPIVKDMGRLGYLIEEYNGTEKYGDIMKRSPISAYKGAMVFFWSLANELQTHTLLLTASQELAKE